jgi:hypothetical protein
MGTGGKAAGGVKLTTHLQLENVDPYIHSPIVKHRDNFTFFNFYPVTNLVSEMRPQI